MGIIGALIISEREKSKEIRVGMGVRRLASGGVVIRDVEITRCVSPGDRDVERE